MTQFQRACLGFAYAECAEDALQAVKACSRLHTLLNDNFVETVGELKPGLCDDSLYAELNGTPSVATSQIAITIHINID